MPPPTPQQQLRREQVESLIGLAAPVLDLVLAVGDRVARIAGGDDDYIPIRSPGEAFELGPSRGAQSSRGSGDGTSA
ncbi:MAG: hypothetical protein ACRDK9_09500 [Solirubrobacterales bacterium]